MLNSALTIEEFGTHNSLWAPFTDFVMNIIAELDVPVLFIGVQAQQFTDVMSDSQLVYELDEIKGTFETWDTKNVFHKLANRMEQEDQDTIMWLNVDVPF